MKGPLSTLEERQIAARVLEDIWCEASAIYWRRRADQFDRARPRAGDYTGQATSEQLAEQDARLASTTRACRLRARFFDAGRAEFGHALESVARGGA